MSVAVRKVEVRKKEMKIQNEAGFSLIEVLVTVLIISIGLLSIAALQINAKKAMYDSVQRTFASEMIQELADRMRANSDELESYLEGAAAPSTQVSGDLTEWRNMLSGGAEVGDTGGLMSPTACVTSAVSSSAAGIYTISIAWRGVGKLTNSGLNDCGNVSPATDADIYGANNEYRRIISIDIFISPSGFGV